MCAGVSLYSLVMLPKMALQRRDMVRDVDVAIPESPEVTRTCLRHVGQLVLDGNSDVGGGAECPDERGGCCQPASDE